MSVFCADQVGNGFRVRHHSGVNCVGGKKITVAGPQDVGFSADAELECAAHNPMGLIFAVRVWAVFRTRRVSPLKDTVAFALQRTSQLLRLRRAVICPSFHSNSHSRTEL